MNPAMEKTTIEEMDGLLTEVRRLRAALDRMGGHVDDTAHHVYLVLAAFNNNPIHQYQMRMAFVNRLALLVGAEVDQINRYLEKRMIPTSHMRCELEDAYRELKGVQHWRDTMKT